MVRIMLLGILFSAPLMAAAAGYRVVHPDGTVEYTDQPAKGAEEIRLPEIPTYPSQPPQSPRVSTPAVTQDAPPPPPEPQGSDYRSLVISSPQEQETVWFNANGMTVSLQVQPGLSEGDEVVIQLDGKVAARGSSTSFTLSDVYRGPHTLSAAITDERGSVLLEAKPVTFFMRQHSAIKP